MHNCVASYRERVLRGESIIMTAKKAGKYVICIELDAIHRLYQAYGPHNHQLFGDDLLACQKWISLCQIENACSRLNAVDISKTDDWEITKLPAEEPQIKMTRDEIAQVVRNGVSYGYYSYMAVAFEQKHPHRISAPPWKTFATEREYLQYVFPEGESIWKAAMDDDNIDAQYALGICYAHGRIMPRDVKRALAWLKHPVEEGHTPAQMLCQKLICDNARINGTYDERIREGLRLARLRIKMQQDLHASVAS